MVYFPEAMLSPKIKLLIGFSTIILSIILTLIALEIVIRTKERIWPMSNYQTPNFIKEITEETKLRKKVQEKGISSNTFNIYYFGESTTWGEPYLDTIPILVEKSLQGKVDGKEIKWVNMGIPGIDFNEAKKRIKQIVDQKNIYFPSLIVIYSGHNEFLNYQDNIGFSFKKNDENPLTWVLYRSRLAYKIAKALRWYRLEIDDRSFFETPIVPPEKYKEIIEDYENKVQSTISYLRNNGMPTIISTVAGNYANFEPNRSVFTGDELKKSEFKSEMDKGSLESYLKALKIDENFAETHYRLGKIYEKEGENEKAWEEYLKAVDQDMMPIRAVSKQNDFIRSIPEDDYIKTIDAVETLKKSSQNHLVGENYFTDAQHPNLKGYTIISELFAKKIATMYSENTSFKALPEVEIDRIFNTDENIYNLNLSRAGTMLRLASWRYDPTQRLLDAENYLEKAKSNKLYINGGKQYWYLLEMTLAYLRKDVATAKYYYQMAKNVSNKSAMEFLKEPWINQIISRALN